MSHYNIDYTKKYPDEAQRKVAAMNDIKNYLGIVRYKKIVKAVVAYQKMTRRNFIRQLSMFVGIEGYPAEVWADELGLVAEPERVIDAATYYASDSE